MNCYSVNRSWSDRFLPEIKRIVGAHLLRAAPDPNDWHEATDLMMLDAKDIRIAARIRRPGYAERYPNQITIRSHIPSGGRTELNKIVDGKGDWMFYGHANAWQTGIDRWWLIDLSAFRAALIRHSLGGPQIRYGTRKNTDGTSFAWFDVGSFPADPPLIVANSNP
ncbi:MAG: hypothetical protein AAGI44_17845 [Pseudomonadota bacterium]